MAGLGGHCPPYNRTAPPMAWLPFTVENLAAYRELDDLGDLEIAHADLDCTTIDSDSLGLDDDISIRPRVQEAPFNIVPMLPAPEPARPKPMIDTDKPEAKQSEQERHTAGAPPGSERSGLAPSMPKSESPRRCSTSPHQSARPLVDKKRQERNAREQRRSLKISEKIEELRRVLKNSGVQAKSSKSSILQEATQYIRQLEEKQVRIEAERAQFLQMWQLSQSQQAMVVPSPYGAVPAVAPVSSSEILTTEQLSSRDYQVIFQNAAVPMAIASVNGNLLDGNMRMSTVTGYPRSELPKLTVFNLVADQYLQQTFTTISNMLTANDGSVHSHFEVRGKLGNGQVGGVVSIALVRDEVLRPKYFTICMVSAL